MTKVAVRKITEKELTHIATEFLRDNYEMELSIPVRRNNRLRTSLGRYQHTPEDEPIRIEIAGFTIKYGAYEVIVDTLKHECIHYALAMRGDPYDDGDPIFEAELRKHNVGSTETNRVGLWYLTECNGCGETTYGVNKRIATHIERYISGCCEESLTYVGERIFDGTEVV